MAPRGVTDIDTTDNLINSLPNIMLCVIHNKGDVSSELPSFVPISAIFIYFSFFDMMKAPAPPQFDRRQGLIQLVGITGHLLALQLYAG